MFSFIKFYYYPALYLKLFRTPRPLPSPVQPSASVMGGGRLSCPLLPTHKQVHLHGHSLLLSLLQQLCPASWVPHEPVRPSASAQHSSSLFASCPICPGCPIQALLSPLENPEFTQTHVHRVGDAIQPSHPLLSPFPPTSNPSQLQSLFQ